MWILELPKTQTSRAKKSHSVARSARSPEVKRLRARWQIKIPYGQTDNAVVRRTQLLATNLKANFQLPAAVRVLRWLWHQRALGPTPSAARKSPQLS